MRIETLDYVSGRTADGRVYSAMQGTVTEVDDADAAMVALMRSLAARRLVRVVDDELALEMKDATTAPVEVKQARVDPSEDLLARAQELGVRVDRRWGADRLRDEITRAEAAQ